MEIEMLLFFSVVAVVVGGTMWFAWYESTSFRGYKVGIIVRESNGSVSALEGSIQQEFVDRGARVIPLSSDALKWLKGATNLDCANEPADILVICILKVDSESFNSLGQITKYFLDFRVFLPDGSIIGAGQAAGGHPENTDPIPTFDQMANGLASQIKVPRKKQPADCRFASANS